MANFTENPDHFPPVDHINQGEKAFWTEGNPLKAPARQFQALVDRTGSLLKALGLKVQGGVIQPSALGALNALGVGSDGKFPVSKILGTDDKGNPVWIDRPQLKTRLARMGFSTLIDRKDAGRTGDPGGPHLSGWQPRYFNTLLSTPIPGQPDNWIQTLSPGSGASIRLNSRGNYSFVVAIVGTNIDKHQLRLRGVQNSNALIEGMSIQALDATTATQVSSGGNTITTSQSISTQATLMATVFINAADPLPVDFSIDQRIGQIYNPGGSGDRSLGAECGWTNEVYAICHVIRLAYDDFTVAV